MKKFKVNKFKTLGDDDDTVKGTSQTPKPDKIKPYKPKDKGRKSKDTPYANIEDTSHYDIPLEVIPKSDPHYTTIDETSLVPIENEGSSEMDQGDDLRVYYSNLGKVPIKNTSAYEQFESTQSFNREKIPLPKEEFRQGSERYYTPMKALDNTQFPKSPLITIIPADEFTKTYKEYIETDVGNKSVIEEEFNRLDSSSEHSLHGEIIEGNLPENIIKNPIENVLPFEDNRVVLKSTHLAGNYINASYIDNYQFIATMHPTAETLVDFLQMLYQTEASMVVMLASRKEKAKIIGNLSNRKAYWPKPGMKLDCDPFTVSVVNTTDSNVFIKQELLITHNLEKKDKTIMHCISAVWNEDSTASNLENITTLLIRIFKQKDVAPHKPIVIHCADGISKTGILLTFYNAVQELNKRKTINIYNAVKNLRRQRMRMIPTLACYNTCYALMNEYCSIHL